MWCYKCWYSSNIIGWCSMDILIKNGSNLNDKELNLLLIYAKKILLSSNVNIQKEELFEVRENSLVVANIKISPIEQGYAIEHERVS